MPSITQSLLRSINLFILNWFRLISFAPNAYQPIHFQLVLTECLSRSKCAYLRNLWEWGSRIRNFYCIIQYRHIILNQKTGEANIYCASYVLGLYGAKSTGRTSEQVKPPKLPCSMPRIGLLHHSCSIMSWHPLGQLWLLLTQKSKIWR